jgi:hypothetical protein
VFDGFRLVSGWVRKLVGAAYQLQDHKRPLDLFLVADRGFGVQGLGFRGWGWGVGVSLEAESPYGLE